MKSGWIKYVVVCVMVVASGATLMVIGHRVQQAQREIARMDRSILSEQENIRVLAAEWSYLNSPERLEKLASKYLSLDVPMPEQLVSSVVPLQESVPENEDEDIIEGANLLEAAYVPARVSVVAATPKPGHAKEKQ